MFKNAGVLAWVPELVHIGVRVCVCMWTLEDAHGAYATVMNDVDADRHVADHGGDDDTAGGAL